MNKIKVGLAFENKDTAREFVSKYAPYGEAIRDSENEFIYDTPMMRFIYIKPFVSSKCIRLNFVYTVKEIQDTTWFNTVVRPLQTLGIGVIDQE